MSNEYSCPNCGAVIEYGQLKCDSCGTEMSWENVNNETENSYSQNGIKDMTVFGGYKAFFGTIVTLFKNLFSGRARRKEYWGTTLVHLLFMVPVVLFAALMMLSPAFVALYVIYICAYTIYFMIAMIPLIALSVRRMHDIGKSGWILLLGLIPYVGSIVLIVLSCLDSEKGTNKYGDSPKYSQ